MGAVAPASWDMYPRTAAGTSLKPGTTANGPFGLYVPALWPGVRLRRGINKLRAWLRGFRLPVPAPALPAGRARSASGCSRGGAATESAPAAFGYPPGPSFDRQQRTVWNIAAVAQSAPPGAGQ